MNRKTNVAFILVLVVSFLMAGCVPVRSSVGAIEGVAVFHEGTPVRGGMIELKGPTTVTALTDSDGTFSLGNLPLGNYMLSVILDNETVHTQPVEVGSKTASLLVELDEDVPILLFRNIGFEEGADSQGVPFGWSLFTGSKGNVSATLDTDRPYEGTYSFRLSGEPGGEVPRNGLVQTRPWQEHYADYVFRLSGYYRSENIESGDAVGIRLILKLSNNDDLHIKNEPGFEILSPGLTEGADYWFPSHRKHLWLRGEPNVDEWQYMEIAFTPPEAAREQAVQINVTLFLENSPGTVWYDNVKLELIPKDKFTY